MNPLKDIKFAADFLGLPVDLPPVIVPNFKLVWGSSQARDPGGA
jgi:hypothetical protein